MKKHMKKVKPALSALPLLLTLVSAPALAEDGWTGHINGFLGSKNMEDQDWSDHDRHGSIGMVSDFRKKTWPVSIAVNLMGTGDEDRIGQRESDVYSAEMQLGLRKVFDIEGWDLRPYLGFGIAHVYAEVKNTDSNGGNRITADDTGTGGWIGMGVYYPLGEHMQIGMDLTYSEAEVKLQGDKLEAGGLNQAFTVGYRW